MEDLEYLLKMAMLAAIDANNSDMESYHFDVAIAEVVKKLDERYMAAPTPEQRERMIAATTRLRNVLSKNP